MPVSIRKANGHQVSTPGGVKAKGTTLRNALRQKRLLNAIDHGWKPTKKKKKPVSPRKFNKTYQQWKGHSPFKKHRTPTTILSGKRG